LIGAARHLRAQHLEVLGRESRYVPVAMRARAEVSSLSVLPQHLLDEGLSDAEGGSNLVNGRVAALNSGDDFLPKV
jgi:hypothetical protein